MKYTIHVISESRQSVMKKMNEDQAVKVAMRKLRMVAYY